MKAVKTKIGDIDVLFESSPDMMELIADSNTKGRVIPTSKVQKKTKDIYKDLRNVIKAIAVDFRETISEIEDVNKPNSSELSLGFLLSGELSAWVLTGKSESSINVKFTWEK